MVGLTRAASWVSPKRLTVATSAAVLLLVVGAAAWWRLVVVPKGGTTLELELSYWQLVVGLVAIGVGAAALAAAMLFGGYAVEQVRLAREALEGDRAARATEQQAEARRVLTPLLAELHHDRLVLLEQLGRARRTGPTAKLPTPELRDTAFHALIGPVWGTAAAASVWEPVRDAYWRLHQLDRHQQPAMKWWAVSGVGAVLGAVRDDSLRGVGQGILVGIGIYAVEKIKAQHDAKRSGAHEGAIAAVQAAMAAIYATLGEGPTDWAKRDAGLAPEVIVEPDQRTAR